MMVPLITLTTLAGVAVTASAFVAGPLATSVRSRPLTLGDRCRSQTSTRVRSRYAPPTSLRASTTTEGYDLDNVSLRGPLVPIVDTVLVEVERPKDMTEGGLVIPIKKDEKPTRGTVVAVGEGKRHWDTGAHIPIQVKPGDRVVFGNFDGTSVKYQGEQHLLMRDTELLMAYEGEELNVDNVRMVGDRVLLRVKAAPKGGTSTASGVLIAASSTRQDRSSIGIVEKVGPGRTSSSGYVMPMYVKPGDRVKYKVRPVERRQSVCCALHLTKSRTL